MRWHIRTGTITTTELKNEDIGGGARVWVYDTLCGITAPWLVTYYWDEKLDENVCEECLLLRFQEMAEAASK